MQDLGGRNSSVPVVAFYDNNKPFAWMANTMRNTVRGYTIKLPDPTTKIEIKWPTSEHYFQAMKFPGNSRAETSYRQSIKSFNGRLSEFPEKASEIASRLELKIDAGSWHGDAGKMKGKKYDVMRSVIEAKVEQNEGIKNALLAMDPQTIIIEHSKSDKHWGIGNDGTGTNHLGIIWMEQLRRVHLENGKFAPDPEQAQADFAKFKKEYLSANDNLYTKIENEVYSKGKEGEDNAVIVTLSSQPPTSSGPTYYAQPAPYSPSNPRVYAQPTPPSAPGSTSNNGVLQAKVDEISRNFESLTGFKVIRVNYASNRDGYYIVFNNEHDAYQVVGILRSLGITQDKKGFEYNNQYQCSIHIHQGVDHQLNDIAKQKQQSSSTTKHTSPASTHTTRMPKQQTALEYVKSAIEKNFPVYKGVEPFIYRDDRGNYNLALKFTNRNQAQEFKTISGKDTYSLNSNTLLLGQTRASTVFKQKLGIETYGRIEQRPTWDVLIYQHKLSLIHNLKNKLVQEIRGRCCFFKDTKGVKKSALESLLTKVETEHKTFENAVSELKQEQGSKMFEKIIEGRFFSHRVKDLFKEIAPNAMSSESMTHTQQLRS